MDDLLGRLTAEKVALDEKKMRLDSFVGGDGYSSLPPDDQLLMDETLETMIRASSFLGKCIEDVCNGN